MCKFINAMNFRFSYLHSFLSSNRLTLAFFALSGLDLLHALDTIPEEEQKHIIEWIYSLQILPSETIHSSRCGFQVKCLSLVSWLMQSCTKNFFKLLSWIFFTMVTTCEILHPTYCFWEEFFYYLIHFHIHYCFFFLL